MNDEQVRRFAKEIAQETVRETLIQLGADVDNPREMQRDFQAVRELREAYSAVKKKALLSFIGVCVCGALAAMWVGFKHYIR